MKATTSIAVIAAWIWIFQGCDTKAHQNKHVKANVSTQQMSHSDEAISAKEHLAMAICNR